MCRNRIIVLSAAGGLLVSASTAAVNLELRAVPEECTATYVYVDLFAVSDSEGNQSIAALDAILAWDSAMLQLIGIAPDSYPYTWLYAGFPNDHNLDGLNDTWGDGNALYTALAQLGSPPAYATPAGLLVTTFKFRKLAIGVETNLLLLADFGEYSETVVYDGFIPGLMVTGSLFGATLTTADTGDADCDGVIGFGDINPFILALSNPAAWQAAFPDCDYLNNDIDCDGSVSFGDINPFVTLLSS
jgi:hypothetical protein